jgi:hypothetical protein
MADLIDLFGAQVAIGPGDVEHGEKGEKVGVIEGEMGLWVVAHGSAILASVHGVASGWTA